jgi:hypothetical protein
VYPNIVIPFKCHLKYVKHIQFQFNLIPKVFVESFLKYKTLQDTNSNSCLQGNSIGTINTNIPIMHYKMVRQESTNPLVRKVLNKERLLVDRERNKVSTSIYWLHSSNGRIPA